MADNTSANAQGGAVLSRRRLRHPECNTDLDEKFKEIVRAGRAEILKLREQNRRQPPSSSPANQPIRLQRKFSRKRRATPSVSPVPRRKSQRIASTPKARVSIDLSGEESGGESEHICLDRADSEASKGEPEKEHGEPEHEQSEPEKEQGEPEHEQVESEAAATLSRPQKQERARMGKGPSRSKPDIIDTQLHFDNEEHQRRSPCAKYLAVFSRWLLYFGSI